MKLISHDLQDGGKLPNRHVFNGMGYDGDNISPHLMWDDVPAIVRLIGVVDQRIDKSHTKESANSIANFRW